MTVTSMTAGHSPSSGSRFQYWSWRDAALLVTSWLGITLAYVAVSESVPAAALAVVALSTAAAMYARLASGRWLTLTQTGTTAALLFGAGASDRLVVTAVIAGLAGAELVARSTRRAAFLQTGALIALVAGLAIAALRAMTEVSSEEMLHEVIGAIIGGLLSAPIMLITAPLAERLFGHTTRLTMSEWLDYEHPLLRNLASSAPGTFQHSINVGVLADAAAAAIRADPFLARVGALYHDVGKMRAPEFFIENQHGENPHDRLDPASSADILRAHVLDGVDLLSTHRMGSRLADFVREHHGTGAMRLFQQKAETLGRADAGSDRYRYPGPRPRSRETAILMMADQLEAAARANPPADSEACVSAVRSVIDRVQEERQLEESGLTSRELALIQPAFARALEAMYHRRLSYPSPDAGSPARKLRLLRRPRRRAAS